MSSTEHIVHHLMLSQLSESADAGVYARIVQAARRHNGVLGISGVLVFDGERFCHLLEGPTVPLSGMFERIEGDLRHTRLRMLHSGVGPSGVALQGWSSGYCGPHDLDLFAGVPGLVGAAALDRFLSLIGRCDLSP